MAARDPLAGYSEDWRERREAELPRPGAGVQEEDPLAGYDPDWREKRATGPEAEEGPGFAAQLRSGAERVVSGVRSAGRRVGEFINDLGDPVDAEDVDELTPQRQTVQELRDPDVARRHSEELVEGTKELPSAVGYGASEVGHRIAAGLAALRPFVRSRVERALPGVADAMPGDGPTREDIERSRDEAREFYGEPETALGKTADIATQFAGEGAQFMLPAASVSRAIANSPKALRLIGQGGRIGRLLRALAGPRSFVGRRAQDVAFGAPLDALIGVGSRPEESMTAMGGALLEKAGIEGTRERAAELAEDPTLRAAGEIGGGFVAGTVLGELLEAAGKGGRRIRTRPEIRTPEPDPDEEFLRRRDVVEDDAAGDTERVERFEATGIEPGPTRPEAGEARPEPEPEAPARTDEEATARPSDDEILASKRRIRQALIDAGDPDDTADWYMLRWQEKANEAGVAQNVWRSRSGNVGTVPASADSPYRDGELLGTLHPEGEPRVRPDPEGEETVEAAAEDALGRERVQEQRAQELEAEAEQRRAERENPEPGIPEPGQAREMPTAEIAADPERFQFKGDVDAEGVTDELKGIKRFDKNLAGVIQVWRDPADGQFYVVNGHHRLELAKRTGTERILARHIKAENAADARTIGALTNIAEGRGSAVDAAKVFRDGDFDAEDLKPRGISLKGALARDGLALSKLPDEIFRQVATGKVPYRRAAVVGASGLDEAEQRALWELVQKKERGGNRLTNAEIEELARFVQSAEARDVSQETLFGTETRTENLAVEKAELSAYVKKRLKREKNLFGFISKAQRAEAIESAGAGEIDTKVSGDLATDAEQALEVYEKLSTMSGPVADALNRASREMSAGANANAVKEGLYPQIKEAVQEALGDLQGPRPGRDRAALQGGRFGDRAAGAAPGESAGGRFPQRQRALSGEVDLFGQRAAEPEGPAQGDLGLEEFQPRTLEENEQSARQTVSILEGKVRRGAASKAEEARYREGLAMLRRADAMTADEVAMRMREAGLEGRPDDGTMDMFAGGGTTQRPLTVGEQPAPMPEDVPAEVRFVEEDQPAAPGESPARSSSSGEAGRAESTEERSSTPRFQRRSPGDQLSETTPSDVSTSRATPPSTTTGSPSRSSTESGFGIDPSSGKKILQPVDDVNELLRLASDVLPRFRRLLDDVVDQVGAGEVFGARAKGKEVDGELVPSDRLLDKVQGRAASTLGDYLGGRIWVDRFDDGDAIVDALEERGWRVAAGEDEEFAGYSRGGYRARHIQVVDPDTGLSTELQLVPREIGEIQDDVHKLYDVVRGDYGPVPKQDLQRIQDRMRERWDEAWDQYVARTGADPETGRVAASSRPKGEATTQRALSPLESGWKPAPQASEQLPDAGRFSHRTGGAPEAPSRSDVVRSIQAGFATLAVREGKLGRGRFMNRALGVHKGKSGVIRLGDQSDVGALAHEIGHELHRLWFGLEGGDRFTDAPFEGLLAEVPPAVRNELRDLGAGISQGDAVEGWAEFWRRWLDNPEAAKKKAPATWAMAEKKLAEHPEIRNALLEGRGKWELHRDATPQARVRSQISTDGEARNMGLPPIDRFRTDVVDDFHTIKRAVEDMMDGKPVDFSNDAYSLARLVRGSMGVGEHFLERGTMDYNTLERNGKGLQEILEPVADRLNDFRDYVVARRALELHDRGINSGIRRDDADWTVAEAERKYGDFEEAAQELYDYNTRMLEYLRDAGVISDGTLEAILSRNQQYVPFYRVMEDQAGGGARFGLGFGHLFSPVKRIKGSGKDIIDPLESITKNTYLYAHLAQKQQVSHALAELAEEAGAGRNIEELPLPVRPVTVQLGEIEGRLREILGDDAFAQAREDAERAFQEDTEGMDPDEIAEAGIRKHDPAEELLAVFRPGDMFNKPNVISVLDGGQRKWYEVDPELWRALEGLDREQVGWLTRWLAKPARTLRAGATLAPEFLIRNPIRDQAMAFVQSEYGFIPGVDMAKGLFHLMRKDDLYWRWKSGGGERAALVSMDREAMRQNVGKLVEEGGVANVIKHPFQALQALSAAMEDATRVAEFANAMGEGGLEPVRALLRSKDPRQATKAGIQEAALAAREISIDFAKHGAKTSALRQIAAFWNARIQGYDRLYQAVKANPVRTLGKTFASITLPSIALHFVNRDNPEYWEIPQWQRDLFWIVPVGETLLRIPKPFELGLIFGTSVERALEWAESEDAEGMTQFFSDTLAREAESTLLPGVTSLMPIVENLTNYSFFLRRPIVPEGEQDVQPRFQSGPHTSEVAKLLGRWAHGAGLEGGISPRKIDNLLYAWSGGLGRLGTQTVDAGHALATEGGAAVDELTSSPAAEIPGVRGVVARRPGFSSESIERFYREYEKARQAAASSSFLTRELRTDELGELLGEQGVPEEIGRAALYRKTADALARLRSAAAIVERDPSLSADEKRTQVLELGRQATELARTVIGRETPAGRESQPEP